jgi:hypothetical protein
VDDNCHRRSRSASAGRTARCGAGRRAARVAQAASPVREVQSATSEMVKERISSAAALPLRACRAGVPPRLNAGMPGASTEGRRASLLRSANRRRDNPRCGLPITAFCDVTAYYGSKRIFGGGLGFPDASRPTGTNANTRSIHEQGDWAALGDGATNVTSASTRPHSTKPGLRPICLKSVSAF